MYRTGIFVDLSEAFDRMQHQQLVNILAGVGVEGTALDWFVSYLSDRRQQVKSGISLGEVKVCSRGVPQGSVLGPLLFTLYTRHFPALLTIQCVMFADDILLFFSSPSQQNCARVLSLHFTSLSRIYLSRIVEKVPKNLSSYAPDQDEGNKQQCN